MSVLIFSDNFSRPNGPPGDGWTDIQGGVWAISGGVLVGTSDASTGSAPAQQSWNRDYLLRPASENVQDQRIVFQIPPNSISGANTAGANAEAVFRYQPGGACYIAQLLGGNFYFEKYPGTAGQFTVLSTTAIPGFTLAHAYQVDATVQGVGPATLSGTVTDLTTGAVTQIPATTDGQAGLQQAGQFGLNICAEAPSVQFGFTQVSTYNAGLVAVPTLFANGQVVAGVPAVLLTGS